MNNGLLKIGCFVLLLLLLQKASSQTNGSCINIVPQFGLPCAIYNYGNFTFISKEGIKLKGKIKIFNDSQFAMYNYFNELGTDTFNINELQSVQVIRLQHYKVRPVLAALGIIYTMGLTVPIIVYKLVAKKKVRTWVDKGNYTIKISETETEKSQ